MITVANNAFNLSIEKDLANWSFEFSNFSIVFMDLFVDFLYFKTRPFISTGNKPHHFYVSMYRCDPLEVDLFFIGLTG